MNFCVRSARLSLQAHKSKIWSSHNFKDFGYLVSRRNSLDIQVIRSFSLNCTQFSATKLTLNASELESSAADVVNEIDVGNAEILDQSAAQTLDTSSSEILTDPYVSPFSSEEIVNISNLLEPSFSSMGLSHWWPSGWMQHFMEFFHVDVGLPWWQTIGITTLCLRLFVAPIMLIAQKNIVKMNNHQPAIQKLQVQIEMSKIRNEPDKAIFATQALGHYFHANNCHPAKAMWPIAAQGICFMSMFFGLRGMTSVPVESLKTGGLYWFTDLTLADPTLILPLATGATIYLQLYLGADGMKTENMPGFMKVIIYAMPLISIPVMIQFPTALNVYWMSNNLISLVQASILRRKDVREKLGFEEFIKWKPSDLPMTSFHEELKREMARQGKFQKEEVTRNRESEERRKERRAIQTIDLTKERRPLLEEAKEELRKPLRKSLTYIVPPEAKEDLGKPFFEEAKDELKNKFNSLEKMDKKSKL